MRILLFRGFSTLLDSMSMKTSSAKPQFCGNFTKRNWNPIPIPNRTLLEPKGQDLDFINVAHSLLIHTDWDKLNSLSTHFTPFRVKHILLRIQKDHVLSLEFFNWVQTQNLSSYTLETHSIILHTLTKNRKFKSAELILKRALIASSIDIADKLFDAILYSYCMCDSLPCVFDSQFKTHAHMKRFRNATNTFFQMKDYGFLPTVESCNAYLSSLLDLQREDIALAFYKEMCGCRISPNVYTLNMIMFAFRKLGKLEKPIKVFEEMHRLGISLNDASYNILITGYYDKGLFNYAMKLKNMMRENGVETNVGTFNTLIYGFCKEGKIQEASKIFNEMKLLNVPPNIITYNTLINGYNQVGNSEMGSKLYKEMSRNGVKADVLTYNALILGLCKEGKTKKAAYMVRELDKVKLIPNASTFSALIIGQCMRNNSDRAFQLYKSMVRNGCQPNKQTFNILISTFCKNNDFEGASTVLMEILERCMTPKSDILLEIYHGLCQCGNDHLAMKLCNEMEATFIMPEGFEKAKPINREPKKENKAFRHSF